MKKAVLAVLVVAASIAATAVGAAPARQQVTVLTRAHSLQAEGVAGLRPGLVDVTVRNVSTLVHGVGVIRLDDAGMTAAKAAKIIGGDAIPKHLGFTLFGGVPVVQPGGSWHATLDLTAGRYALFDDGANGKGMLSTFTVSGARSQAQAPHAVGTITMRDFAFGIRLPAHWNGRGVVRVPNVGKEIHELTFIRMSSHAELVKDRAMLSKGWPTGPIPKGITYALGGSSPGRTTWVGLHLAPGTYLAICLFPDPATGKPHTALGMLSTLVVS
jgi:hypothetical protein